MTSREMHDFADELISDMDAMEDDGWICNDYGWWHAPSCVGWWPWDEARKTWKKERAKKSELRK